MSKEIFIRQIQERTAQAEMRAQVLGRVASLGNKLASAESLVNERTLGAIEGILSEVTNLHWADLRTAITEGGSVYAFERAAHRVLRMRKSKTEKAT